MIFSFFCIKAKELKIETSTKIICIYPKDIQRITGKSERYSRNLILKIKTTLNKEEHQVLTVQEFCTYMGIPYESIQEVIRD